MVNSEKVKPFLVQCYLTVFYDLPLYIFILVLFTMYVQLELGLFGYFTLLVLVFNLHTQTYNIYFLLVIWISWNPVSQMYW